MSLSSRTSRRVVVCALGENHGPFELPASRAVDNHPGVSGGERSLYEMAVAAAAGGYDVELRGTIDRAILRVLTDAARCSPIVTLAPRRPTDHDIVIVPEATHPHLHAATFLSAAATVMVVLAPPGLFGWDLTADWRARDPHDVPIEDVGTVGSFQRLGATGLTLWTNAHGIARAGAAAGVHVKWIGTGTPVSFPVPVERPFDAAVVVNNRWYDWAADAAHALNGVKVLHVPPRRGAYSLCDDLARARLLIWPSRIEGMSRIAREARAVGTVPVALDTNPFASPDDHGPGVALVRSRDAIVVRVRELASDHAAWQELSGRAIVGARAQVDWRAFVDRVAAAIEAVPVKPRDAPRSSFGDYLQRHAEHVQRQLAEARAAVAVREREITQQRQHIAALTETVTSLDADVSRTRDELAAFRRRRVVRFVDETAVGRLCRRAWRRTRTGPPADA